MYGLTHQCHKLIFILNGKRVPVLVFTVCFSLWTTETTVWSVLELHSQMGHPPVEECILKIDLKSQFAFIIRLLTSV